MNSGITFETVGVIVFFTGIFWLGGASARDWLSGKIFPNPPKMALALVFLGSLSFILVGLYALWLFVQSGEMSFSNIPEEVIYNLPIGLAFAISYGKDLAYSYKEPRDNIYS